MSSPDHRSPDEVIGTWGGDFGELLLALAVTEQRIEREMRDADVKRFVLNYIRLIPAEHFFYGTDAEALSFVGGACGLREFDPTEVEAPLRQRALDAMTHTSGAGMGDLHTRWILTNPEDYEVRRGLIESAITAFHELLWKPPFPWWRAKIHYFVHRRVALMPAPFARLEVMGSPDCTKERRTLPIPPLTGNPPGAVAVFHPQAIEARRRATAGMVKAVDSGPYDAAAKAMLARGADWDQTSDDKYAKLFPGLPTVQIVAF